ncbi:hypothetical protein B0T26DRAFT_476330 [Lasiosphaeria miniovina]|uniref:DUF7598 domain-containing protein n=1 Tax=Lasiosphaeria miniovina TaxID=1954250 RepID=A0AA40A060_9PEZI|nr:uncharacterized protein B0T26DRAFT_476330 [Lasiosphaeria miniovina]KAK0706843.1 hypothetical protein B0T26DRAFT_476330 [Lasiosphaeria miniovina]
MFNLGENSKVRGSGHLILNAIRALTIVTLGTVMVASWAMIVLSGITAHFDFFDMISHFFIFVICIFLVISELGLFKRFFEKNWPVLSPSHSLMWLGLAILIIGCQLLADLTKPAYTLGNLGLSMYRLVLASGILCLIFGISNILVSIIFRDGTRDITARQIRSHGNLAGLEANSKEYYDNMSHQDSYSQRSNSHSYRQAEEQPSAMRRMTQVFNVKNFRKSKIAISKPFISEAQAADIERNNSPLASRTSPIVPAVQRPPTALHPAFTGGSHYSTAHMDRF